MTDAEAGRIVAALRRPAAHLYRPGRTPTAEEQALLDRLAALSHQGMDRLADRITAGATANEGGQ